MRVYKLGEVALLQGLAKAETLKDLCERLGVSSGTVYRAIDRHPRAVLELYEREWNRIVDARVKKLLRVNEKRAELCKEAATLFANEVNDREAEIASMVAGAKPPKRYLYLAASRLEKVRPWPGTEP